MFHVPLLLNHIEKHLAGLIKYKIPNVQNIIHTIKFFPLFTWLEFENYPPKSCLHNLSRPIKFKVRENIGKIFRFPFPNLDDTNLSFFKYNYIIIIIIVVVVLEHICTQKYVCKNFQDNEIWRRNEHHD